MKTTYRVHRLSWSPVETKLTLPNGQEVVGTVQCLEMELTPHEHLGGSTTHRYVGDEAQYIAEHFHEGDIVSSELTEQVN